MTAEPMKPAPPVTKMTAFLNLMGHGSVVRFDKGAVDGQQILAITALCTPRSKLLEVIERNVAKPKRDLLGTSDTQPLPLLEDLNKVAGFHQRSVGAGVEPRKAAAQHLDEKVPAVHVGAVEVGNFQFAARRWF